MRIISGGFDSPKEASRRFSRGYVEQWLAELRRHHRHYQWIARNAGELRQVIVNGLNMKGLYDQSLEGLYLSSWYTFMLQDYRGWIGLVHDALPIAMDLKDSLHLQRVYTLLGYSYILIGKYNAARHALHQAREYAAEGSARQDRRAQETLLLIYNGLLKLETYRHKGESINDIINEALALADTLKDPDMTARLDQVLAAYYLTCGEPHRAVDCGVPALGYWRELDNHVEIVRTALPLVRACSEVKNARLTRHFLEIAQVYARKAPQTYLGALVQYEQGIIDMSEQRFDAALLAFDTAVDVFDQLELPYHLNMTRHSLGLVHLYNGFPGQARLMLEAGLKGWQEMGNGYEVANCHHALGYLHAIQGKTANARLLLTKGMQLCDELPESAARRELEQLIRETLGELDRDAYATRTA